MIEKRRIYKIEITNYRRITTISCCPNIPYLFVTYKTNGIKYGQFLEQNTSIMYREASEATKKEQQREIENKTKIAA